MSNSGTKFYERDAWSPESYDKRHALLTVKAVRPDTRGRTTLTAAMGVEAAADRGEIDGKMIGVLLATGVWTYTDVADELIHMGYMPDLAALISLLAGRSIDEVLADPVTLSMLKRIVPMMTHLCEVLAHIDPVDPATERVFNAAFLRDVDEMAAFPREGKLTEAQAARLDELKGRVVYWMLTDLSAMIGWIAMKSGDRISYTVWMTKGFLKSHKQHLQIWGPASDRLYIALGNRGAATFCSLSRTVFLPTLIELEKRKKVIDSRKAGVVYDEKLTTRLF